jgi:hypothetical protein
MPAEPGFRSRQALEARGGRGRRRAPSSLTGKNLFLTGLVILLLMSAGMLALRSLAVSIKNGGDDVESSAPAAKSPKTQANTDPFAGTPAAQYPVGAAGVVVPPGKQVGPWTPAQVQDVLTRTKQTLIAARLEPQMLEQGDPAGYLKTISESARGTVTTSLQSGEALGYVTRLASEYELADDPRVKGTMTVTLGPKKELVVGADYVWIYPLTGPTGDGAPSGPGSKLVVVHTIEAYQWFATKSVAPKDTGLRPGAGKLYTVNMDCDLAKSGKLGLQRAAPGNPQNVPEDKAYDPATRPEDLPETC